MVVVARARSVPLRVAAAVAVESGRSAERVQVAAPALGERRTGAASVRAAKLRALLNTGTVEAAAGWCNDGTACVHPGATAAGEVADAPHQRAAGTGARVRLALSERWRRRVRRRAVGGTAAVDAVRPGAYGGIT